MTTAPPQEELQALTVRLPKDMHRELKHVSIDDETTINDIAIEALNAWLRNRRTTTRKR